MKAGITGLIDRPAEGAKEEGLAGFIAGMAKGIVGAVAAPVAGALGAVSRVTEGVDASTRYRGRGVLRTSNAGVLDSVTSRCTGCPWESGGVAIVCWCLGELVRY